MPLLLLYLLAFAGTAAAALLLQQHYFRTSRRRCTFVYLPARTYDMIRQDMAHKKSQQQQPAAANSQHHSRGTVTKISITALCPFDAPCGGIRVCMSTAVITSARGSGQEMKTASPARTRRKHGRERGRAPGRVDRRGRRAR